MPRLANEQSIKEAAAALQRGELVAFPTETVYGLGANALDLHAVAQIFEAKGRPHFDPLIVHVLDVQQAKGLVAAFPAIAERLAKRFWPGPMTLVLPKRLLADGVDESQCIADLVTSGLPNVAIRVPSHPVARALLKEAGVPIAAPSANRFGGVSPTTAAHVQEELGERVRLILDGGPCETGVESTVISVGSEEAGESRSPHETVHVLRLGGLPVEAIEDAVGGPVNVVPREQEQAQQPKPLSQEEVEAGRASPGMLDRHYAPATPMELVGTLAGWHNDTQRIAALSFRGLSEEAASGFAAVEVLSESGDLREAAARLFACIRRLDRADVDLILAERLPEEGLGRAINDRLRRGSVTR